MILRQLLRAGGLLIGATVLFASRLMAQDSPTRTTAPWERLAGVPGGYVGSVVFDRAHPGVAFAGSGAAFIYRSLDGGATWKGVRVGTINEGFRAIAVSPSTPGTVFAYSTDNSFSGLAKLYRSVDDGQTWTPLPVQPSSAITGGFFAGQGRDITIDPTGRILVLTDAYSGVLRSADAGTTWTNPVANAGTYGLSADTGHRGVLWTAGSDYATGLASLWRSTDFGATWTEQAPAAFNSNQASEVQAYAISVQPGTGLIVASWTGFDQNFRPTGGVVVSEDGGRTWAARGKGLLPGFSPGNASGSIAFDPLRADTIYLSTDGSGNLEGGGMYRSCDSGRNWQPIGNGLRTLGAFGIWLRPEMHGYPAALFAGTPDLFISTDTDHASRWERADTGLDGGFVQFVTDDELAPGGYYAASGEGLFHSTNDGANWNRINTWDGPDGLISFAVDRNTAARTLYAPSYNHVWRSSDAGRSWSDVTPRAPPGTFFDSVLADPHRADHIFALANDGTLFQSGNGGYGWKSVRCGAAGDYPSTFNLLASRTSGGGLYVPLASGLWIASADGSQCTLAAVQPIPAGYIFSIIELGTSPTAVLVSGFQANGDPIVVRSSDGGATYLAVESLPGMQGYVPWFLTSSPDLRLGVGSFNGSTIAVSRDGGANWNTQPDVLLAETSGDTDVSGTRTRVFWGDASGALYAAPNETLH